MAIYTILPRRRQSGYKVLVFANSVGRHTILDFETEADAISWVGTDIKRDHTSRPALLADPAE